VKKNVLALSALLLGFTACTTAPADKSLSAKEKYADELLAIVPPSVMFSQLAEPHIQPYVTPQQQEKAHANFMRNVDVNALDAIIRAALVRHFTEAELAALVKFYSTPEGRSCMTKIAPFAAEVVPACAHEATRAYSKTAIEAASGLLLP